MNRPPSWKIKGFSSKPIQRLLLECHILYEQRQTNDSWVLLAGKVGAVIPLVNVTSYLSLEHRLEASPSQSLLLWWVICTVATVQTSLEPSWAMWSKGQSKDLIASQTSPVLWLLQSQVSSAVLTGAQKLPSQQQGSLTITSLGGWWWIC